MEFEVNLQQFMIFFSELEQGEVSICADFGGVKLIGSSESGSESGFIELPVSDTAIDESLQARLPNWVTKGLKKFSDEGVNLHIYIHDQILLILENSKGKLYINFPIES